MSPVKHIRRLGIICTLLLFVVYGGYALGEVKTDGGERTSVTDSSSEVKVSPPDASKSFDFWEFLSKVANILEVVGFVATMYIGYKAFKIDSFYTRQVMIPRLSNKIVASTKNLHKFANAKMVLEIQRESIIVKVNVNWLTKYLKEDEIKTQAKTISATVDSMTSADELSLIVNAKKLLAELEGLKHALDNIRSVWNVTREKQ